MKNVSFGELKMITFIAHPFVNALDLQLKPPANIISYHSDFPGRTINN